MDMKGGMSVKRLVNQLESTGLPVTYLAWPENDAPALPYICYLDEGSNPTFADGQVYYSYDDVRVELYTRIRSADVEMRVEAALAGYHWKKDNAYLDTELCFKITYDIEV